MHALTKTLCVCVAALVLAGAALADPNPPPNIPRPVGKVYAATLNLNPGVVLQVGGTTESLVYMRPSSNNLTSFVFRTALERDAQAAAPPLLHVYYSNAINETRVYRTADVVTYSHKTYVREVAVGPDKALYFSESSGAGGDGKIWRLDASLAPTLYYTVRLAEVGGFWAGHFAFSPGGRLFVANGNTTGARIWQCPVPAGAPTAVYSETGTILGFSFLNNTDFLYTNGTTQIRKAALGAAASTVFFTSRKQSKFCDVLVW